MVITVAELWTYPVKSCRGLRHEQLSFGPAGPQLDRQWMVIDGDGTFVSQREHPKLALVQPSLANDHLVLDAPGMPTLSLPSEVGPERRLLAATLWDDPVVGVNGGDSCADWFSAVLGTSVRLVGRSPAHPRHIKERYRQDGLSPETSFADGFAALLTSHASLRSFNEALEVPVPMDRFRANIVVDGDLDPWIEDTWRRVQIGGLLAEVVRPCDRCPIPDTDQTTGERGTAVRSALGKVRRGHDLTKPPVEGKRSRGIFFGQNLALGGPFPAMVRVGDDLSVVTREGANIEFV